MSTRTSLFALALAIALMVALPFGTPFGRLPSPEAGIAAQGGRPWMQGMQASMPDMMKMHEKMMAEMRASQSKLDDLAKKMNSASGGAKVDAMAELLNELVRQHRTMGEHMGGMHQHMMGQSK